MGRPIPASAKAGRVRAAIDEEVSVSTSMARMHTAEHLLSAVMRREFGTGRRVETHLGRKKSKCDYVLGRALQEDEVRRLEGAVNAEIAADHEVYTVTLRRERVGDEVDLSTVPNAVTDVRLVQIGSIDRVACIGEHVAHTACIGRFVVHSWEMRDDRTVRIRFTLGEPSGSSQTMA